MKSIIIYALATCYLYPLVCSSNILVFMPSSSKSHKNTFDPLIEELIKRNHSVTEVTMYPSSKSMPGKKTIFTEFIRKKSDEFAPLSWQMSASSTLTTIWMIMGFGTSICPLLYEDPALLEFIKNPGGPYDLVLVSSIFNDCYLSVVGTYGAPVVMISPSAIWPDVAWQMDIPNPWSYSPFLLLPYSSEMTFFQRLWNSLLSGFWTGVRWFIMHPSCDSTVQKFVPNAPSIRDVIKNVSFLLVNSHVSMDDPKPLMPYMAEVGAMHCRPAQKLPEVSRPTTYCQY